jgi:RimJ/RimL family protein N-acetyltransferase
VRLAVTTDAGWLTERTGHAPGPGFRALVALDTAGVIRGGVGFDGWTPGSVHLHVVLDTPVAGRALLRSAFAEAFSGGRLLVRGEVRASNARSLTLARRLGFRETHRVRDGWAAGEDMVLFEMRREECRWLKEQA